MKRMLNLAAGLDWFSQKTGQVISWLTLLMVLIGAFNAIARTLGRWVGVNLASNALIEAQWYLFSLIFLFGAAYTLKHGGHVRVDVVYGQWSDRTKAWINLGGTLLFLLPFCLAMLWLCWPSVYDSWSVWETSPDPDGLPRYPIKTCVIVAFVLLTLQAISETIKNIAFLKGYLPSLTPTEEGAS